MTAVHLSADAKCAAVQRQLRPTCCRTIELPPAHRSVLGQSGRAASVELKVDVCPQAVRLSV